MKRFCVGCLVVLLAQTAVADQAPKWIKRPELIFDEQAKQWQVTFELDSPVDVEVAIVAPDESTVVRHLAAGVLGSQAPPPLIANSGVQRIAWDGNDDYGVRVADPASMLVRVRAGMSVSLEQIVGGDPYAYYSDEMGDSDHSPWGISGLETKADGNVYVWGHSSNLGPPALRQYDVDGNYLQTLFPMPAGKDLNAMHGWGINVRPDGTYTPKFNRLTDPSLTTTFLDSNLGMARLLPTPDKDHLTFWRTGAKEGSFDLMTINADGTIDTDPADYLRGPLVKDPPFVLGPVAPNSHVVHSVLGPVFVCYAPDGESFYLSGVYAATTRYGTVLDVPMDGFWRDGQVWKVDVRTRTAKVFFALDPQSIPTTQNERASAYSGLKSYAALHGVAVDQKENVFVCDRLNKRVIVFDKQGKTIRQIPVEHPDAITISQRTGALFVTTRVGDYHRRGAVQLLKFNDWRTDDEPATVIEVSQTGYTGMQKHSYVVVCDTKDGSNIWVAYTQMPVRVYRDDAQGLRLLKDFYRVDKAQRCLGFDRMQVDQQTEEVYVQDAHDAVWKIADWQHPRFIKIPLQTASIAGGARFDLAGNLYVGYVDKPPTTVLPGFEGDTYMAAVGRIHKYAPTGALESGNLFPKVTSGPSHTYDILYGAFETKCVTRSPRFGLDAYGRIYYPTNIAPRVTVMDNAGNEILHFGTYGNRDSMGGLADDLVPTKDIPLGFPNSVDATDDYIYVADMVNQRLLRLKKNFQVIAAEKSNRETANSG